MTTRRGIGYGMCVLAACLTVAGKAYHVVARPEWTEPQVLRALWPVWLAAAAFVMLGAWLLRGKW